MEEMSLYRHDPSRSPMRLLTLPVRCSQRYWRQSWTCPASEQRNEGRWSQTSQSSEGGVEVGMEGMGGHMAPFVVSRLCVYSRV